MHSNHLGARVSGERSQTDVERLVARADCCDGAMAHHANLYTIWQDPEKGPLGLNPTPSGEEKQPLTPTEILATRRLQRETTSVDPKKPPQGESS